MSDSGTTRRQQLIGGLVIGVLIVAALGCGVRHPVGVADPTVTDNRDRRTGPPARARYD